MSTCQANIPGHPECGAPTTVVVEYGCVHEHIDSAYICLPHLAEARTLNWSCKACDNGPRPHNCPIIMRERQSA